MGYSFAQRWQKARKGTQGFRNWRREIAGAIVGGFLAFVAIRHFASSQGAIEEAIAVVAAMIGTVILLPAIELVGSFLKAPMSLATEEIAQLSERLRIERRERHVLQESLEPKLLLVFDRSDPQCLFDSSEADAIAHGSRFRILRVRVENTSASRLERVRVLVEELGQPMPLGPQPLQFMDDFHREPPEGVAMTVPYPRYPDSIRGLDFSPYERRYVGLFFNKASGHQSDQFDMYFAEGITPLIPATPRRIVLVAYADNALPTRLGLRIQIGTDGLADAEQEPSSP